MIRFICLLLFLSLFAAPAQAKTILACRGYFYQGQSLPLKVYSDVPIKKIEATFLKNNIPFFRMSEYYRGYLSALPEQQPGLYTLYAQVHFRDGSTKLLEKKITLRSKWYPKVSFWVKPSKKKLMKKDLIAEEWAQIEKSFRNTPQQLWNGNFIRPVPGITTMAYGVREYVNRKPAGRHRGQDFRAQIGTPVKCPNHGTIIFARQMEAFGGTVVVDHGLGVHSLFLHLSKFLKPVGTELKKGEVFALTGNSGISSGPHLHWGLSVSNVRIDPAQWMRYRM